MGTPYIWSVVPNALNAKTDLTDFRNLKLKFVFTGETHAYFSKFRICFLKTGLIMFRVFTADLVTFTEEILNGKLHFLCSVYIFQYRDM